MNLKKGAHRRLFLCLACLWPVAALATTPCPAERVDEVAQVSYVHDGDTVHLVDGRKIRLIGINTPELGRDAEPDQAYAQAARAFLAQAIAAHDNRVALAFGAERHDRHQRTLAHLFSPQGDNLQAQLLQQGLAAVIAHPPNTVFTDCYAKQERLARCAERGLWSDPEHAVLQASALKPGSSGFRRVSGRVERISQSRKGVWLFMSELMIGVYAEDLDQFDRAALLALKHQPLTVRGWLQPANKKQSSARSRRSKTVNYFLRIRHPSALEIERPDSAGFCPK